MRLLPRCLLLACLLLCPWLVLAQTVPINGNVVIFGHVNSCSAGGSANTYACSLDYALTAYQPRACYQFTANAANNGAAEPTLNLNAIGAKTIKKLQGGITTALVANDIRTGQVVQVCYDGTNLQMVSPLGNAPAGSGAVTSGTAGQPAYYPAAAASVSGATGLTFADDGSTITAAKDRITTIAASKNPLDATDGPIIACTGGASDVTLVLPAGATTAQRRWTIVKVDAGAGKCLVDANGSETINGATGTAEAATQWSRVDLVLAQTTGTPNWSAVFGKTAPLGVTDGGLGWTDTTFSGTTHKLTTMGAGNPATDDCAKWDANDNLISSGAPCGTGASGVLSASAERITTVSASKTLDSSDGPIVACTAATDITLTLPTGSTADAQRHWTILKIDAGSGKCLVAPNGSDTINGAGTAQQVVTRWGRVDLDLAQTTAPRNWSAITTTTAPMTVAEGGTGFTDTTYSGTTHKLATMGAGSPATDDCVKWDANDNLVSSGAACGGGTGVTTGDKTDITVSTVTLPSDTWTIDAGAVTYAKMQDTGANSVLLGRGDSGTGPPQNITLGSGLAMAGAVLSVSGGAAAPVSNDVSDVSVTTATNPSTEAQLKQLTIPAGALNLANQQAGYRAFGRWAVGTATPTARFRLYLCTVSGCGSGTVLTLADFTTAGTSAVATNSWMLSSILGTAATGVTGTLETRHTLAIRVGTAAPQPLDYQLDQNNAVSASIDLTAQLFLRLTVLMSNANAGNIVTQRAGSLSFPSSVSPSSATTFTNKTYDAEATGNVFTSTHKYYLEAASCQGTTAQLLWDTQATEAPAAACYGTNRVKGVADFNDSADNAMHRTIALPADFTGAVDVRVFWFAAAITNVARFGVRIDCYATGEDHDGAVTNSTTFAGTPSGTTNRLVITSQAGVTTTGCAAGELARVDFFRDGDGTSGTDSLVGNARVVGLELTFRRQQ